MPVREPVRGEATGEDRAGGGRGARVDAPTVSAEARSWSGPPPAMPSEDPLVGTTLNQTYEIVGVLAEGGMGRVYEARHTRIPGKRLTVKVLHEEYVRKAEAVERFQREAEAAAAVQSPHVIRMYDVHRTPDGRPFLVAEYLEGVELGEHLDAVGTLPVALAVRIARQVCQGLAAAHAAGVVHRDVKPENIFLTGELAAPVAKILDFGISRLVHKTENRLTKTGMIMGTPAYMAPEQAVGKDVDQRADVYGVGAILYRALTGVMPFDLEDPAATILAVATQEPPRPRSLVATIPDHLEMVVQRAMAKDAADRYGSAAELDAALAPFDDDGGGARVRAGAGVEASGRLLPGARVSVASVGAGSHEVEGARSKLIAYMLLSCAVVLLAIASAIGGLLELSRAERADAAPSKTELLLVLLALGGTLVTPAVLIARHVKRTVWGNTAKVLGALGHVRAVLLAAVGAYGLAALVVAAADGVFLPLADADAGVQSPAAPQWRLLFTVVAALAAGAVSLSRGWGARVTGRFGRIVVGPVLAALTVALSVTAVYLGFGWRSPPERAQAAVVDDESAPTAAPPPSSPPAPAATTARATTGAEAPVPSASSAPEPEPSAAPSPSHASDQELAAAREDTTRLAELASRFPEDRTVLAALAHAHGKKKEYRAALDAVRRLVAVAPDEGAERRLRLLIATAAQSTDAVVADAAYELMKARMGEHGPDLLYDLVIGSAGARERAERALDDPDVQKLWSPALAIAWALRTAPSCAARLPLLARAGEVGDQRTIGVLSLLSEGKATGCGAYKRQRCAPTCPVEAPVMRKTIEAIQSRHR